MKDSFQSIFSLIHKGLRASLCLNLVELGRIDETDTEATHLKLEMMKNTLQFCTDHLAYEENYILPVIKELNKTTLQPINDHCDHKIAIDELQNRIFTIQQSNSSDTQKKIKHSLWTIFYICS